MPLSRLLAAIAIVMLAAGCYPLVTPDVRGEVHVAITNETGRIVVLRATAEGQGISSDGTALVGPDEGAEITVPLTDQWAIWIDGILFLSSQGRPDLAPPPARDLRVEITVDSNGPRVTHTSFVTPNAAP